MYIELLWLNKDVCFGVIILSTKTTGSHTSPDLKLGKQCLKMSLLGHIHNLEQLKVNYEKRGFSCDRELNVQYVLPFVTIGHWLLQECHVDGIYSSVPKLTFAPG